MTQPSQQSHPLQQNLRLQGSLRFNGLFVFGDSVPNLHCPHHLLRRLLHYFRLRHHFENLQVLIAFVFVVTLKIFKSSSPSSSPYLENLQRPHRLRLRRHFQNSSSKSSPPSPSASVPLTCSMQNHLVKKPMDVCMSVNKIELNAKQKLTSKTLCSHRIGYSLLLQGSPGRVQSPYGLWDGALVCEGWWDISCPDPPPLSGGISHDVSLFLLGNF